MSEQVEPKASRARARASREDVDARIDRIEGMMSRLEWRRGESNRELAEEWGVSIGAVNDYAGEAGRRHRAKLTDKEAVTETVSARMQAIVHTGDDRDAVKAGDVWTRIVGARAPERHEHAHVVASYEALPREDKAKWLRERAAQLLAEADRLDGVVPAMTT